MIRLFLLMGSAANTPKPCSRRPPGGRSAGSFEGCAMVTKAARKLSRPSRESPAFLIRNRRGETLPTPRRESPRASGMNHIDASRRIGCAAVVLGGSVFVRAQSLPAGAAKERSTTQSDIEPIFKTYCYECHGPKKARGRFRLHAPEFIRKGGASGPVIRREERRQPDDSSGARPRRRRSDAARWRSAAGGL